MPRAKKSDDVVQLSTEPAGSLAVVENNELDLAFDVAIQQAKEEIARIDERADFAISVVTQAIKTQATVAKGRVLVKLRERFDQVPALDGKWLKFVAELDVSQIVATQWMNAARAVDENSVEYGEDFLMGFSSTALAKVQTLPAVIKDAVLSDAVESGVALKVTEMEELHKKPQTKLAKAMEALEAKADRLGELQSGAEPTAPSEKSRLTADTKKLEDTIEVLKSQIAEDKIKAEQAAKDTERLNAELELLKYDDIAAREQRIKRVSSSLIVQLPAVLSDLQKYIAEAEHYESKTRKSIDTSVETLVNFLKPIYA